MTRETQQLARGRSLAAGAEADSRVRSWHRLTVRVARRATGRISQLYLGELAQVAIRQPGASNVLAVPRCARAVPGPDRGVADQARSCAFQPVHPGVQTAERVQILSGLVGQHTR